VEETLKAAVAGRYLPLSETNGSDPTLSEIIDRALATDPNARFASADAFADALEVYQNSCEDRVPALPRRLSGAKARPKKFPPLAPKSIYFADFTPDELSAVLQLSRQESYESGEVIIREGAGGSTMYVVVDGLVAVRKAAGKESVEIKRIGSGDCFGEMAVVSQMPRAASVVALEPTSVLAISGAVLRLASPGLCLKLYRNIAALLADRVREVDQQLAGLREVQSSKRSRT
jgi:CRP-like cAMP-binding protein